MGLDMYLTGEKYHWTNWENPKANRQEDGFEVKAVTLALGYWRKHPNLHGYIVQTFADGTDDCERIYLDREGLLKIISAIKENKLPVTEGFFFGSSDGSETEESIRILEEAVKWLEAKDAHNVSRRVYYQASW